MNKTHVLTAATAGALLVVASCSNEPVTDNSVDAQAEELAEAAPMTLPPAIKATTTYRCKDNSVVYVTFLADDITTLVRKEQGGAPLATLKAPATGQPFVADGFSLTDSGDTITYSSPDAKSQSCNA